MGARPGKKGKKRLLFDRREIFLYHREDSRSFLEGRRSRVLGVRGRTATRFPPKKTPPPPPKR